MLEEPIRLAKEREAVRPVPETTGVMRESWVMEKRGEENQSLTTRWIGVRTVIKLTISMNLSQL